MRVLAIPPKKSKRGNRNWGKPPRPFPAITTEFELEVQRLGLSKAEYAESTELQRWCQRNRNRVYIPEWLLNGWGIEVEALSTL